MPTQQFDHSVIDLKMVFDPLWEVAGRYVRLQRGTKEARGLCPFHAEKNPSFYVYRIDQGAAHQRFVCFGCGARGDVIDFLCRIEHRETKDVIREIRDQVGLSRAPSREALERIARRRQEADALPPPPALYEFAEEVPAGVPDLWNPAGGKTAPIFAPKNDPREPGGKPWRMELPVDRVHEYRGWRGELLGYVVRTPAKPSTGRKKSTPQVGWARNIKLADGSVNEGWCFGSFPVPRAVFGASAVSAARDEGRPPRYLIVEGEKNQEDAARVLSGDDDRTVVSWVGGGQAWAKTDWAIIAEGDVALWPDNDPEGDATMAALGAHLWSLGCRSLSWIRPAAGRGKKWDVSDALTAEKWSPDRLRAFIADTAYPWSPALAVSVGTAEGTTPAVVAQISSDQAIADRRLSNAERATFGATRKNALLMFESVPPEPDDTLPGLRRKSVGSIIGAGGVGKSYAALQTALSIAVGCDLWGLFGPAMSPLKQGRVLYVNGEDDEEEIWRRAYAMKADLVRRYGDVQWEALVPYIEQNLVVHCTVGTDLTLAELNTLQRLAMVQQGALFPALMEVAEGTRLIILDTTSKVAPELDEADSVHMTAFMRYLDRLARKTEAAVIFVHHMNKSSQSGKGAQGQGAASGSHKITNNARWQLNMWGMSEEDALDRGEDPETAWSWVGTKRVKANYVRGSAALWWRRTDCGLLEGSEPPPPTTQERTAAEKRSTLLQHAVSPAHVTGAKVSTLKPSGGSKAGFTSMRGGVFSE